MTRSLALLGFALALGLAAPLGNEADARSHYRLKRCIAPATYGTPLRPAAAQGLLPDRALLLRRDGLKRRVQ